MARSSDSSPKIQNALSRSSEGVMRYPAAPNHLEIMLQIDCARFRGDWRSLDVYLEFTTFFPSKCSKIVGFQTHFPYSSDVVQPILIRNPKKPACDRTMIPPPLLEDLHQQGEGLGYPLITNVAKRESLISASDKPHIRFEIR